MYSRYYIGTGEQTAMYTLRHQYEERVSFLGEGGVANSTIIMRDHYMHNLATDAKRAAAKAKELGFKVEKPKFTLQEIKRRSSEVVEAARVAAEEKFATSQKMKLDEELKLVSEHCFPFGCNKGETFEKMIAMKGTGWAGYWMEMGRQKEGSATIKLMGTVLESLYPEIARIKFMADTGNDKYYGEVGVRQKLVKVTNVGSFNFDGYYGTTFIEKFHTETGELLVYMGSACMDCDKGDELVISFGIKEHSKYEGEIQTKIQRVKINS